MNNLFDEEVSIQFTTTATVTPRTVIAAEVFGLGIDDEKEFKIYDKTRVTVEKGDVVFITGDSGGGKSTLLRRIKESMQERGIKLDVLNDLTFDPEEVILEGVGKDFSEALGILTRSGLGDAFLMLRKYKQLSDGQKYRYAIAKMLATGSDVWFIDEFCATLDREMAKVIAFSIQKTARMLGKTIIVATTHGDIEHDLNPSLTIKKNFGEGVSVTRNKWEKRPCSLMSDITFRIATFEEYQKSGLPTFHYKSARRPAGLINIYAAEWKGVLVGAMLLKYPPLELQERNFITQKYYTKNYKELNKDVETISRVVINPKFQGIGLAPKLMNTYFNSEHSRKIVEAVSVMAQYHPFNERAGMKRIEIDRKKETKHYQDMIELLEKWEFDMSLLRSGRYNFSCLEKLTNGQLVELVPMIMKEYRKVVALYSTAKSSSRQSAEKEIAEAEKNPSESLRFISDALKRVKKPSMAYIVWFNPRFEHDYTKAAATI